MSRLNIDDGIVIEVTDAFSGVLYLHSIQPRLTREDLGGEIPETFNSHCG